jgi:hypothetical protein
VELVTDILVAAFDIVIVLTLNQMNSLSLPEHPLNETCASILNIEPAAFSKADIVRKLIMFTDPDTVPWL